VQTTLTLILLEPSDSPRDSERNLSFDSGEQNALQVLNVRAQVSLSSGAQGDVVRAFLSQFGLDNCGPLPRHAGGPEDIGRRLILNLLQDDNNLLRSQVQVAHEKYGQHANVLEAARAQLKDKEAEIDALSLSLRLLEEGIAVWQGNGQTRSLRASGPEPLADSREAPSYSRETSLVPFIKCKSFVKFHSSSS